MDPLTVSLASYGVGVGSSILGAALGFGQADQQRAETAEQVRRFQRVQAHTVSETEALGNASGITSDSGSLTKYLADMSSEFAKQTDWMKQAGEAKANATDLSTIFGTASNLAGSTFKFGAANNWFRQPTIGG